jgi:hypothetical protein
VEQLKKKIYKYIIYNMKYELSQNIVEPLTLKRGKTYIVTAPVKVFSKLTIEDDVNIYIRNDSSSELCGTSGNGLTFASSSQLHANEVDFFSCNYSNEKVNEAVNGGLVFNGTIGPLLEIPNSFAYSTNPSNFVATKIRCHYLGGSVKVDLSSSETSDSITINNCNSDEWNINSVSVKNGGGTSLVTNQSQLDFEYVAIEYPSGDYGLEVTNSTITVTKGLKIKNGEDGGLIEMNTDQTDNANPLCYVKLPNNTKVYLNGEWVDGVVVVSKSLPQPSDGPYFFKNCTACGQSYIFPAVIA